MDTPYARYLYTETGTQTITELIHDTDITHSSMSRYLSGERKLPISVVAAMCDKYGISLLDSMVAAQFITKLQAARELRRHDVQRITDQELAAEVLRRLEKASHAELDAEMRKPAFPDRSQVTVKKPALDAAKTQTEDVPEDTP